MKRNKEICVKCTREISKSNFSKHVKSCKGITEKRKTQVDEKWLQTNGKYKCPYCEKEYKKFGIGNHIWRYHTEEGKNFNPNIGYKNNNRKSWNKGLTKDTDERVKLYGEKISISNSGEKNHMYGKHLTTEAKENLSFHAIKHSLGNNKKLKSSINYLQKNGTNVVLESRYELKIAKELDKNNIDWIRPNPIPWRDNNGQLRNYFPDFYLPQLDIYLDPKSDYIYNLNREGNIEKFTNVTNQNNVKIAILNENLLSFSKFYVVLKDMIKNNTHVYGLK